MIVSAFCFTCASGLTRKLQIIVKMTSHPGTLVYVLPEISDGFS